MRVRFGLKVMSDSQTAILHLNSILGGLVELSQGGAGSSGSWVLVELKRGFSDLDSAVRELTRVQKIVEESKFYSDISQVYRCEGDDAWLSLNSTQFLRVRQALTLARAEPEPRA